MTISEVAAMTIVELHHTTLPTCAGELELLAEKVLNCRMMLRLSGVQTITANGVVMTLDEACDHVFDRLNKALLESVSLKLNFVKSAKFTQDWFGNTGVTVILHLD